MPHILFKPSSIDAVAVSGGPDSMCAMHFLTQGGKYPKTILHFFHGTEFGSLARKLVRDYCEELGLPLIEGEIAGDKPSDESLEEFWRNQRIAFFQVWSKSNSEKTQDITLIASGHNLDDAVETWLFSCMHGRPDKIPEAGAALVRPFLLWRKEEMGEYCRKHNVPYIIDPSNEDRRFMRSIIRHDIMPLALQVNPGIYTVVKKMYERKIYI